jgi:hypothetical protein
MLHDLKPENSCIESVTGSLSFSTVSSGSPVCSRGWLRVAYIVWCLIRTAIIAYNKYKAWTIQRSWPQKLTETKIQIANLFTFHHLYFLYWNKHSKPGRYDSETDGSSEVHLEDVPAKSLHFEQSEKSLIKSTQDSHFATLRDNKTLYMTSK